jgi:hypothetical protein
MMFVLLASITLPVIAQKEAQKDSIEFIIGNIKVIEGQKLSVEVKEPIDVEVSNLKPHSRILITLISGDKRIKTHNFQANSRGSFSGKFYAPEEPLEGICEVIYTNKANEKKVVKLKLAIFE